MSWNLSKVRSRSSSIGGGSQTRSAANTDQQRKAHQPRKAELPRKPAPQDLQTLHFSQDFLPCITPCAPIMQRRNAIGHSPPYVV